MQNWCSVNSSWMISSLWCFDVIYWISVTNRAMCPSWLLCPIRALCLPVSQGVASNLLATGNRNTYVPGALLSDKDTETNTIHRSSNKFHLGKEVVIQLKQPWLALIATMPEASTIGGMPGRRRGGRSWPVGESRASYLPPNSWVENVGGGHGKWIVYSKMSIQAQSNDLNDRQREKKHNLLITYNVPSMSPSTSYASNDDSSNGSFDESGNLDIKAMRSTTMLSNVTNKKWAQNSNPGLSPKPLYAIISWVGVLGSLFSLRSDVSWKDVNYRAIKVNSTAFCSNRRAPGGWMECQTLGWL